MSFPRIRLAITADIAALAHIEAQAATLFPASRIPQVGPGVPVADFARCCLRPSLGGRGSER